MKLYGRGEIKTVFEFKWLYNKQTLIFMCLNCLFVIYKYSCPIPTDSKINELLIIIRIVYCQIIFSVIYYLYKPAIT